MKGNSVRRTSQVRCTFQSTCVTSAPHFTDALHLGDINHKGFFTPSQHPDEELRITFSTHMRVLKNINL